MGSIGGMIADNVCRGENGTIKRIRIQPTKKNIKRI